MNGRWHEETEEDVRLLAQETAILAASEAVSEALADRGIDRSEFAERLGVKKSEISQRLSGKRNLTVRSFADMLHVLGYEVEFRVRDLEAHDDFETKDTVYRAKVGEGYAARPGGNYTNAVLHLNKPSADVQ